MQDVAKKLFLDFILREPGTTVTRKRAAELAIQAGYTDWPGFKISATNTNDHPPMAVVTSPSQLPRAGATLVQSQTSHSS